MPPIVKAIGGRELILEQSKVYYACVFVCMCVCVCVCEREREREIGDRTK